MAKIRKTITLTVIVNKVMTLTIMIITATTIVVNNNSSSNQIKKNNDTNNNYGCDNINGSYND